MRLEPMVCFFVSLLIVFLKLLILFSQIELENRYGREKMRRKWNWLGTRVAKCLEPQVMIFWSLRLDTTDVDGWFNF